MVEYTNEVLDSYFLSVYFFVYFLMLVNAIISLSIFSVFSKRINTLEQNFTNLFMLQVTSIIDQEEESNEESSEESESGEESEIGEE